MKKSPKTAAFLTRFEASTRLKDIYLDYLTANKLVDTERVDWYSVLTENGRDPLSLSAIKKGCPRGNRAAYTRLNFIKIMGRPYYIQSDIDNWFRDHFESRILNRAA